MKKNIKFLFFFAVTLLFFYLISRKIDYLSLKEVFSKINYFYLAAAVLAILLVPVISAKKWQSIMGAMNHSINFKESLKIVMAALPVSAVTPAKSGDLIRAYYLRDKAPVGQVMGGVLAERFIDVAVLALYSLAGALLLKNWLILGISLSVVFLIPLFFLAINRVKIRFERWRERIESFLHVSKIFIRQPQKILPLLFYSAILWSLAILVAKFLFLALRTDVPLSYIAAAFPIVIFIGLIPITIAGMGIRDSAIIYFFSFWAESSVSLGVGLLYSLLAYGLLALLGLPVMRKML